MDDRRHVVDYAEIARIVEPIADQAGGDLAVDLGDHGVVIGKAAFIAAGALAPQFEHRLARRRKRAPHIGRHALAGDVDQHGERGCVHFGRGSEDWCGRHRDGLTPAW
jgi:hypothetical protein